MAHNLATSVTPLSNNKAINGYELKSGDHWLVDPSCGLIMANTLIG